MQTHWEGVIVSGTCMLCARCSWQGLGVKLLQLAWSLS